ncbi:FAD-binding protein [Streptomyces sp. XM83C]|jgi:FAD/FMN-containing dehydrogenase|uniref:FAD-binding protein n=1 Tax=Streptomyces thermocoprophilus TaxID=78356 RepID=A0ABV5VGT1_9ACTN|nr:FAD-binding protein [Streptomyces sp. XM83C]MCK1821467.1 FAD-binding protein [Streptomyces sp. XM83C]
MPGTPSRRTVLRGLAVTGAAVIGFDPATRSWAAEGTGAGLAKVPRLDGTLFTDAASLAAAAEDYGHLVHRRPRAVLRPGSVRDVVAMIRFCNEHCLPVAPRGEGHQTHGQAQVQGGLVIETGTLAAIGPVKPHQATVTVGAGAKWSDVARATLVHGLTPPVFTDYIELSVGGTLSVGGIGGQGHRHGVQVDNVTELKVVTGSGELVRCSPTRQPDLFHAVLAGLGQCGVIVEATLRLVRAPRTVRHYTLTYDDLETFVEDECRLLEDDRFAYVGGQISADSGGAFRVHTLEAVAYGPPVGPAPNDRALLRGLRHTHAETADLSYFDFLNRLAPLIASLKAGGFWTWVHPWLNLILPSDAAVAISAPVLAELTPAELGPGVIQLYPLRRERLTAPLFRAPDDPMPFLFDVLPAVAPDDTATIERRLVANRAAYEAAVAVGGTQYPVGSIPFDRRDWRTHFGDAWPQLVRAKRRYDPRGLLTPGQGIF